MQEEETGVFLKDGVRGTTGVARDVFLDVATQHVLDLLLLETSLDDELIVAVDGSLGTQLSKQELTEEKELFVVYAHRYKFIS